MKIRDIVTKRNGGVLASGSSHYEYAIVASLTPFTLISEEGDMMWSTTVKQKDFTSHGQAPQKTWDNVLDRLKRNHETLYPNIKLKDEEIFVNKLPKFIRNWFIKTYNHQGIVYLENDKPVYCSDLVKFLNNIEVYTTSQKRADKLAFNFLNKKYPEYGPFIQLF